MKKWIFTFLLFRMGLLAFSQESAKILNSQDGHFVKTAEFSPDGKFVLTSGEGKAKIWNPITGIMLQTFDAHRGFIQSAHYSPDGKRILTCGDSLVKIWDAETGRLLRSLECCNGPVYSAGFSPNGKFICTQSGDNRDNTTRIWDAVSGKLLYQLKNRLFYGGSDVFSPDGNSVLLYNGRDSSLLIEVTSGKIRHKLQGILGSFSPDGKQLATIYVMRLHGWIWNAITGKRIHEVPLENDTGAIFNDFSRAKFSPDGKSVLFIRSPHAHILDVTSGKRRCRLKGLVGMIESADFSPDGRFIVTSIRNWPQGKGSVCIWDAANGQIVNRMEGFSENIGYARYSPDGRFIVAPFPDQQSARIWDAVTGRVVQSLQSVPWLDTLTNTQPVSICGGGKYLFSGIKPDGAFSFWEASTGKEIYQQDGFYSFYNGSKLSPDGRWALTRTNSSTQIREVAGGKVLHDLRLHTQAPWIGKFNREGNRVLTAYRDGSAGIWDAASGKLLHQLKGHRRGILSAEFSQDGKWVITASGDSTARIWETGSGLLLKCLNGHAGQVVVAGFSADGKQALTASTDKSIRTWDVVTGKEISNLTGHKAAPALAVFSPDGKRVLSSSGNGSTRMHDAISGKQLFQLRNEKASLSPDGKTLLSYNIGLFGTENVKVRDAFSGKILARWKEHKGSIWFARFSPDGKSIVSVSNDGMAIIRDAISGKPKVSFNYFGKWPVPPEGVNFSENSKQIQITSWDGLRIWDVEKDTMITALDIHESPVQFAEISPDGKFVMTITYNMAVRVWDVASGKLLNQVACEYKDPLPVIIGSDGKTLIVQNLNRHSWIFGMDMASGKLLFELKLNNKQDILPSDISPDGNSIITANFTNRASLVSLTPGKKMISLENTMDTVRSIKFNPDGKTAMTLSSDNIARIWDAATGKLIRSLNDSAKGDGARTQSADYSPDGNYVVTTSVDNQAKIQEAGSGKTLYSLPLLPNIRYGRFSTILEPHFPEFSPDGQNLLNLVQTYHGIQAEIREAATGKVVQLLGVKGKNISSAGFSPDGKTIYTAMDDGTSITWAAATGKHLSTFVQLK